jgi:hypothetical protein
MGLSVIFLFLLLPLTLVPGLRGACEANVAEAAQIELALSRGFSNHV